MPYALCFLIFVIGLYCAVVKKNMVKIVVGILVMEYAVNLFFILIGYNKNGRSPIFSPDQPIMNMVDPLPQALVLTAIVIGLAVTALTVGIAIRIYEKYGTFDITKIRKLHG